MVFPLGNDKTAHDCPNVQKALCYFDLGSVSLRNTMEKSANPEDTEPAAKVLARLLDDMEFLGEFKTDAASGSCWIVAEQILQAEPIKQDRSKRPPAITA